MKKIKKQILNEFDCELIYVAMCFGIMFLTMIINVLNMPVETIKETHFVCKYDTVYITKPFYKTIFK